MVTLKLVTAKKDGKILYAEAEKDFVDFMFNFLSLSLGTTLQLLTIENMDGSLGNLSRSVQNMSDRYMNDELAKEFLLSPLLNPFRNIPRLFRNMKEPSLATKTFYRCNGTSYKSNCSTAKHKLQVKRYSDCNEFISNYPDVNCYCSSPMDSPAKFKDSYNEYSSDAGGYVKGGATYMVMDDLTVKPIDTESILCLLDQFNLRDAGSYEKRVVTVGTKEAVKLLKATLKSKTVLSDVFIQVKEEKIPAPASE